MLSLLFLKSRSSPVDPEFMQVQTLPVSGCFGFSTSTSIPAGLSLAVEAL
jgi:hypothetical protein